MQFADRRKRADPPLPEEALAARPVAPVSRAQQRRIVDLTDTCRSFLDTRHRNRTGTRQDHDARALELGEVLKDGLMRTQRAVRDQCGEHIAEIVEYRLDKNKRHGRGSRRAECLREIFLELERAANDARAPAIIVAEDTQYLLGQRAVLQRAVRR